MVGAFPDLLLLLCVDTESILVANKKQTKHYPLIAKGIGGKQEKVSSGISCLGRLSLKISDKGSTIIEGVLGISNAVKGQRFKLNEPHENSQNIFE